MQPATSPYIVRYHQSIAGVQSWISGASGNYESAFLGAIHGKADEMLGLKENVITGHHIPAGTGLREFENMIVGSKEEYSCYKQPVRQWLLMKKNNPLTPPRIRRVNLVGAIISMLLLFVFKYYKNHTFQQIFKIFNLKKIFLCQS